MKRFLQFVAVCTLLLVIAFGYAVVRVTNPVLRRAPVPSTSSDVSVDELRADVEFLVQSCYPRDFYNPIQLEKAAGYIRQRFEAIGYPVTEQAYQVGEETVRNLIVTAGPETLPTVVVGAHYDVCGPMPGADDNASGVAGLLALAKLLKADEAKLTHRFELVAYTLEEPPFFRTEAMGSAVHARALKESGRDVRGMISVEMIGYFSDEAGSQHYPLSVMKALYPDTANFIGVIGSFGDGELTRHMKRYMRAGSELGVESINAPAVIPGIDFSDHLYYWEEGYTAVMISDTSFYRNDRYHEPTDTIDTLDYDRMAEVVKGLHWALLNL